MGLRDSWRISPTSTAQRSAGSRQSAWDRHRRTTALGIVICLLAVMTGCGHEIPDVNAAAENLASALQAGTLDELPLRDIAVMDAQTEYRDTLASVFAASQDTNPEVTVSDVSENVAHSEDDPRTATATFEWAWPIGDGQWTYTTQGQLVLFEPAFGQAREPRWEIVWDPNMLLPELQAGEVIDSRIVPPTRADILDGAGEPLITERPVVHLGIDKATAVDGVQMSEDQLEAAAKTLARAVNNAGHSVDVDAFIAKVAAAGPRDFVELIALRTDDSNVNVEKLLETAGVRADEAMLPLGPTDDFASAVLGTAEASGGQVTGTAGLQQQYNDQLAGLPGITVFASGPRGERELFTQNAVPGTAIKTTFDVDLQKRAEEVLAHVSSPAALVAIRPSTGEIVAAASGPGSLGNDTALTGQYAPGQAFTVVSALALGRKGVSATSTVNCEPSIEIDERPIENFPDFPESALGQTTFREAFVNSCNTAFVSEADKVTQADLVAAANDLGFGDLAPLGTPAFFGTIPSDADAVQHAASLLGQDRVLASPLAMARVAASIAKGERVDPFLVHEESTAAAAASDAATESKLTAAEATALRDLMRDWVQGGSTYYLPYIAGLVGAKAGIAQAAGGQTHAWIIGITNASSQVGELAIAIFVEVGHNATETAAPLLYKFISGNEVPPPPAPVVVEPEYTGGTGSGGGTGGGGTGGGGTGGGGGGWADDDYYDDGSNAYRPDWGNDYDDYEDWGGYSDYGDDGGWGGYDYDY